MSLPRIGLKLNIKKIRQNIMKIKKLIKNNIIKIKKK